MSLITNLTALLLIGIGYYGQQIGLQYSNQILTAGIFAFSGAITNWLAVHMLFEKVPFLYGSGVIPNKFEEFKNGIKKLIINEFFNREHLEKFFADNNFSLNKINEKIDLDRIYEGLVEAIMNSQFGGMLNMFGGKQALEPLKEPIEKKIQEIINELISDTDEREGTIGVLVGKVEEIIDSRLQKLTPKMVKDIIQDMIRKHLGWLVVWGGVFGGLIGLAVSFV